MSADATMKTYTEAINAANVNGQLDDATFRITVTAASEVTVSDATAVEGEALSFTVRLANAVPGGLTVTPVFGVGTAGADVDYTPDTTPLSFTGTAAEERTFTVPTIEDEVVEAAETFEVSAGGGAGTITDDDGPNEPPDFDDAGHATTRAVAENTPAGVPVGVPVAATDPNGDVLSYVLSGSDAFAINSNTGQITVSEGASLDYEAGPLSYAVSVTVNDGREGSDAIEVLIGASLESVQVHWRTPANTGPAVSDYDVQYRKQGAADWTSHAFTGTETDAEIPGIESDATYEARVRAKNAEGPGAWSVPGSGRTRVNTAPVVVDDVITVFRGRSTTSLWADNVGNVTRNPSASPRTGIETSGNAASASRCAWTRDPTKRD